MQPPRVNPVGLLETPEGACATPRRFTGSQRLLAGIFLALFFLLTVATTVASLGRYCLTTDAADMRTLPTAVR